MGTGDRRDLPAVRHALASGYRLIDTAEMYADGGAEQVVGQALKSTPVPRDQLCVVTKVLPQNASRAGTIRACEDSLRRLDCGYVDLYLLHWRGRHPFAQTLEAFMTLRERGLIRRFGISNFDVNDLAEWRGTEKALGIGVSEGACTNQLYYSAATRGIEFRQLAWQRAHGFSTMAYSPLGQGMLLRDPALIDLASARGISVAQLLLAWVLRQPDVVAIPKSADPQRIEQNLVAATITLSSGELAGIDAHLPPPSSDGPLVTT